MTSPDPPNVTTNVEPNNLPGVGVRRKGPKSLPRLPLSAFTPPNSGTSDRFPLPPSPSTVHPHSVVDSHIVLADGDLASWNTEMGQVLGGRIGGVVVQLAPSDSAHLQSGLERLQSSTNPILTVAIPFQLESTPLAEIPFSTLPISLYTSYADAVPTTIPMLRWALERGRAVDIDCKSDVLRNDTVWEGFEDLLTKATVDLSKIPPIVLSNLLPPPNGLALPTVTLLNHPTYRAFQTHVAALSLFPYLYIKFLPPNWVTATPSAQSAEAREWKKRIKMYLGPVLEAFGYERILFGSSPAGFSSSSPRSNAADWYGISRESLVELGVEQSAIEAVFSDNARVVYGNT